MEAPWLRPGRHDLLFTITAGADVDVLTATLVIPENMTQSSPAPGPSLIGSAFATGLKERFASTDSALLVAVLAGFVLGVVVTGIAALRRRAPALALILIVLAATPSTPLLAHEGEDHGDTKSAGIEAPLRDLAQRQPDGTVFVPKPTQRILSIRTVLTEPGVFRRTVELPGRIIPDPNASGYVQAAVGGRLSPPPGGFPRLGTRVKKGDVLAYVTPPLQAIDVSDMRQRQGELDQQISIVERRLARYEQLAPSGAVPRSQLDETRLELQGLQERRAALDKMRREPEALVAPVDGVIADGNAGRRPDRANQRGHIPDRRSGAALGRGAELRSPRRMRKTATARTGDGRT